MEFASHTERYWRGARRQRALVGGSSGDEGRREWETGYRMVAGR